MWVIYLLVGLIVFYFVFLLFLPALKMVLTLAIKFWYVVVIFIALWIAYPHLQTWMAGW